MRFSSELHCHSTHSDGHMSPKDILSAAKKKNIDIIAITDHDKIAGALEAERIRKPGDPFVVPGIEISTPHGHLLAYFVRKNIASGSFEDIIKEIHNQGGIAIMAHPVHVPLLHKLRGSKIKLPPENILRLLDGIEVYNSENSRLGNREALAVGKKLDIKTQTAGSDAHYTFEIGSAKTYFDLIETSETEIKNALKTGNIQIDKNPKYNRICYFITAIVNLLQGKRYGQM